MALEMYMVIVQGGASNWRRSWQRKILVWAAAVGTQTRWTYGAMVFFPPKKFATSLLACIASVLCRMRQ